MGFLASELHRPWTMDRSLATLSALQLSKSGSLWVGGVCQAHYECPPHTPCKCHEQEQVHTPRVLALRGASRERLHTSLLELGSGTLARASGSQGLQKQRKPSFGG